MLQKLGPGASGSSSEAHGLTLLTAFRGSNRLDQTPVRAGLKILQLTAPDTQPNFYGFPPAAPKPDLIARAKTPRPALALPRGWTASGRRR